MCSAACPTHRAAAARSPEGSPRHATRANASHCCCTRSSRASASAPAVMPHADLSTRFLSVICAAHCAASTSSALSHASSSPLPSLSHRRCRDWGWDDGGGFEPPRAAALSGVSPPASRARSCAAGAARSSRRHTLSSPAAAAQWRARRARMSRASTAAPPRRSSRTAGSWPLPAAQCRGVAPASSAGLAAAPAACSSASTAAACPRCEATCNGVKPRQSCSPMSAPNSARSSSTRAAPFPPARPRAAQCAGVCPCLSRPSTSQSARMSCSAACTCPPRHAQCSGRPSSRDGARCIEAGQQQRPPPPMASTFPCKRPRHDHALKTHTVALDQGFAAPSQITGAAAAGHTAACGWSGEAPYRPGQLLQLTEHSDSFCLPRRSIAAHPSLRSRG